MNKELFKKRLKARCKQLGITQKQAAEKAGISIDTLNTWIGKGKYIETTGTYREVVPSVDNVAKLSLALGVSVDFFINPDMEYLTISNKMISDYTGLSDAAIECLHSWHSIPQEHPYISNYSHDIDTLNKILEFYKKHKEKWFSSVSSTLFHFIYSFMNAHKFRRVDQKRIRYRSGDRYEDIEEKDTIIKHETGNSDVIDELLTPFDKDPSRDTDTSKIPFVNTENENERYNPEAVELYREYAKSQIISELENIQHSK